MNYDKYGEVINGDDTYKTIVENLYDEDNVMIGWTDQKYDHRDIFFSLENTRRYGELQRGIKPTDLFVG